MNNNENFKIDLKNDFKIIFNYIKKNKKILYKFFKLTFIVLIFLTFLILLMYLILFFFKPQGGIKDAFGY